MKTTTKIRSVFHREYQPDFTRGFEAKRVEIEEMGFVTARDKFNRENPVGESYGSLGAFYYASGEVEALHNKGF